MQKAFIRRRATRAERSRIKVVIFFIILSLITIPTELALDKETKKPVRVAFNRQLNNEIVTGKQDAPKEKEVEKQVEQVVSQRVVPKTSGGEVTTSRGNSREIYVVATAYTWTGNKTATGSWPKEGLTIAVDPRVIPLHSNLEIWLDGVCLGRNFKAHDTGGVIKGNKIDIYMNSYEEAVSFGRRTVKIIVRDT